ncbi:hypothetical protein BX667DRAFT_523897 [Coemansia mojavensis]|nr:hypothetical protein BX667DRAFT_523897 [Coemansia mojavensis]
MSKRPLPTPSSRITRIIRLSQKSPPTLALCQNFPKPNQPSSNQPYPHKQRLLCKFQLGLLKNHQTPTANIVIAHHAHNHAQPKIAANTCSVPNFFKTQPIELKLNTQPHPCKNPLPTKFQPDLAKTRQTATANTIIANHTHNQAQPKISANTCIETNFSKTQPIEPKLKPQPHPYKQRLPTKFQPNRAIFDRMPTANTIIARHAHNHAQPEMSASTCSVPNFFKTQPIELKLNTQPHPCKNPLPTKFQPDLAKTRQTATANTIIANHTHNQAQPKISANTCIETNFSKTQPIEPKLKPQPHPYKQRLPTKFQPNRAIFDRMPTANTIIARHAHNHAQPEMSASTCTVAKFSKSQPTELKLKPQPHPYKRRLLCKFQPSRLKNRQTATANTIIANHAHNHAQPKIATNTCSVTKFSKTQPTALKSISQPHPYKRRLPKFQLGLSEIAKRQRQLHHRQPCT